MDDIDRMIVNLLQTGFPVCELPYREAAQTLGITEDDLIARISRMLDEGVLTRFGPLFQAEQLGGAFTLAAISVPEADFERTAAIVNAMPEVAHNYERDHELNMWFVLATETAGGMARAKERIERDTGYPVIDMPKTREYFVGLKFEV
ncbi:MAG: AsnC family transcriptional regulator [Betaproteobacteria bacterium]|nr:AsnC family transcriptional regulator [Betaproteobacteria bacterium]